MWLVYENRSHFEMDIFSENICIFKSATMYDFEIRRCLNSG